MRRTDKQVRQDTPPEPATDWSLVPVVDGSDDALVMRALRRLGREPALLVTTGYLLVSLLGLWCSYWFYRGFGLSILDYLQASDFLVAGLRDPMYALLLVVGMLAVALCNWPDTLRRRNAGKLEQLRARSWAWRMLLSRSVFTSWDLTGMRPLTAMTGAVALLMALCAARYVMGKGEAIRTDGRGEVVTVHLSGDAAALPGTARLLGTSSAFVFLWWPQQRRAEALPIAAIRRLQSPAVIARPIPPVAPARPVAAPAPR